MTHECRGGWAIWYVWQTIRSCSSSETTESERVYLRGGSQRAFPRSLIRDSDSVEEVRGRGGEGRWRRRRRARTGCIGISGDNQMISIRCYSLKSVWGEGNRRKMVKAHLLAFYIYTFFFSLSLHSHLLIVRFHLLHLSCSPTAFIFFFPASYSRCPLPPFFFLLVLFVCDLTALFLGTVRYSLMPTLNHEISRRLNKWQGQRSLKREEEIKCKAGELGRFTAGGKKRREGRKLRREEAVMISS